MNIKYAKSTGGFYIEEIHSEIPEDAINITQEEYSELLDGQSCGKKKFHPILVGGHSLLIRINATERKCGS